jgi:hypothetical protein
MCRIRHATHATPYSRSRGEDPSPGPALFSRRVNNGSSSLIDAACATVKSRFRCLFILASAACGAPNTPEPAVQAQAVIYDADDRRDLYDVDDISVRALALNSTAVLFDEQAISFGPDDSLTLSAQRLGDAHELCASERFVEQPAAGRCSAILIDDDLLVTAAHCVITRPCARQLWVFGSAPCSKSWLSFSWIDPCRTHGIRLRWQLRASLPMPRRR